MIANPETDYALDTVPLQDLLRVKCCGNPSMWETLKLKGVTNHLKSNCYKKRNSHANRRSFFLITTTLILKGPKALIFFY